MIFTLNFQEFLYAMYKYVLHSVVEMSLMLPSISNTTPLCLGALFRGHAVVNRQIGVRGFQICGQNLPLRIPHVIRRMRNGCKRIINSNLWEMSELITQDRIATGSSKLLEGLII